MRATPLDSPNLSEWRWIVDQITRLGFTGSFLREGALPERGKRVQVRNIKHLAPRNEVSKYAEVMRNGDRFPPIIVTRDKYLVDGNTRTEAAYKINRRVFDQFRLDIDYASATASEKKRLKMLGAGMNGMNGRGMDRQNIEDLINEFFDEGDTAKTMAAKIHYPVNAVRRVFAIQDGRKRLMRLGVLTEDTKDDLSAGHLQLIGGWQEKMTDPVVANLAVLAHKAGFGAQEMAALGRRILEQTTENAKLTLIEDETRGNLDRINGISRVPAVSASVRQVLGRLNKLADNPGMAVERDPKVAPRHLKQLETGYEVLGQIIKEQMEAIGRSEGTVLTEPRPTAPAFRPATPAARTWR